MGEIVKFGRKSEEEKYEEALLAQYKEHFRPKETEPNQSVAFILNHEKVEIARKIEKLCEKLGVLFGWEGGYELEKRFFPAELTTIQLVLTVPDVTIETEEAKKIFTEAVNSADWVSIGSPNESVAVIFYVKNVVKFKAIKK